MPLPDSSSPAVPGRDPYRTDCRLWLYAARGVEAEPSGRLVAGRAEFFAADDADAMRQARVAFHDVATVDVARLPLPAVEPPGFGDDALRVAWSEARLRYRDAENARYWRERAAAGPRSAILAADERRS